MAKSALSYPARSSSSSIIHHPSFIIHHPSSIIIITIKILIHPSSFWLTATWATSNECVPFALRTTGLCGSVLVHCQVRQPMQSNLL
jgi:hypothetical protein